MRDGLEADLSNFSLGQPESRGKAHAHRMNLLVPPGLFHSSYKRKEEQTHSYVQNRHQNKKKETEGGRKRRETKMHRWLSDRLRESHASSVTAEWMLVVTKLEIMQTAQTHGNKTKHEEIWRWK